MENWNDLFYDFHYCKRGVEHLLGRIEIGDIRYVSRVNETLRKADLYEDVLRTLIDRNLALQQRYQLGGRNEIAESLVEFFETAQQYILMIRMGRSSLRRQCRTTTLVYIIPFL